MDEGVFRSWSNDLPLRAQFEALFRGLAAYTLANPKDVSFIPICSQLRAIPQALRERTMPSQRAALDVIAQGQTAGLLRRMEPHLALAIASGMVVATASAAASGKFAFGDAELDVVVESSWRALASVAGLEAPA